MSSLHCCAACGTLEEELDERGVCYACQEEEAAVIELDALREAKDKQLLRSTAENKRLKEALIVIAEHECHCSCCHRNSNIAPMPCHCDFTIARAALKELPE